MRILAIDPGTNSTGVSILELTDLGITVIFVETIHADKLLKDYPWVEEFHGSRYARIVATADRIEKILHYYNPEAIVSESPYMGKFAQSFAALTELISEIRSRIFQFCPTLLFITIDPASVKKFIGVSGKNGDKELMRKALLKQNLLYRDHLNPINLDEHSIDSIAIGLWFIDKLCITNYGV